MTKQKKINAKKKIKLALEVIRGRSLDEVCHENLVTKDDLKEWQDIFLKRGELGFKTKFKDNRIGMSLKVIYVSIKDWYWKINIFFRILIYLTISILISFGFIFYYSEGIPELLALIGVFVGLYAALEAARAVNGTKQTINELEKAGFILSEAYSDFNNVYEKFLIKPLTDFETKTIKSYLLLSTPAYGYPVLGKQVFDRFLESLKRSNHNSNFDFIFFSPDGHIQHFVNTLIWSSARGNNSEKFAIDFGSCISEFMNHLITANYTWKLWATNETTLRIFAYDPENKDTMGESHYNSFENSKSYIVFSDKVSIPIDQKQNGEPGFRARGFPLLSQLTQHIIGEKDSYFEQLKKCPYTLHAKNDAAILKTNGTIEQEHKKRINFLSTDYILGRTEQQPFNFPCFYWEMERYLKKRHQIDSTITTKDILIRTTKVLFSYFDKFIGNSNIDDGTFYGIYLGQYLILAFCSKFISGKLTHYQIDDKIGIKNILAEIDKKTPNDIMEIIIKLEIVLREIDYQEKPFKGSTDITNEFFDERITIIINNNQYYTSFSELFNTAHPVQNPFSILKMKINEFITSYIFNLKLIDDLTTKDQSNKDGIILEQNLKFVIYSLISSGFLESSFAGYIRNKYFFKNI